MPEHSSGPLGSVWDGIMAWLLLLGGVAMVLGIGYIAYGLFFAANVVFGGGSGAQAAASAQILSNLHLACTVMLIGGVLVLLGALGRYWNYFETGAILLLVGIGLLVGFPYVVGSVATGSLSKSGASAEALLNGQFAITGALFAIAGALQLLIQGISSFVNRGARQPAVSTDVSQGAFTKQKPERRDKFLGPCWTLPFCRDSAKRVCPVLHRKRPCWRDGHGCYCDQNIVMMLSGDRGRSASRSAQGLVSMQSLTNTRPKTSAEKRAQCLGCPIYLHRQNQKYRMLAPATILMVAGLFALNKLAIDEAYPNAVKHLGLALNRFAYSSATTGPQVPDWAQDLASKTSVEWMVAAVIGLLIVAYLLHGLEWALYRIGL